jgi:opacity protein-like surface antigen
MELLAPHWRSGQPERIISGQVAVARMSVFSGRSGLALVLAALCLGGRTAHAQAAPVSYWIPGWPLGFGDSLSVDQRSNRYGNFPSFDGSDARGGFSRMRYNFSNGWFVGSERGGMGLNPSGIGQNAALGNFGSFHTEGVQFGYNFNNAPLSVYAGFDTLKYDAGIGGGPFAPFDTMSGTLPGFGVHAGVEFRPTSNLSLSLGVGYTQQSGRTDSDINSPLPPGAAPFAFGRR